MDGPRLPKLTTILIVLVSLLATVYHRQLTTQILSIIPSTAIKTDAASMLIPTDAAAKKASARKKFGGAWEVIRLELLANFEGQGMPVDAREWYMRVSNTGYVLLLLA